MIHKITIILGVNGISLKQFDFGQMAGLASGLATEAADPSPTQGFDIAKTLASAPAAVA